MKFVKGKPPEEPEKIAVKLDWIPMAPELTLFFIVVAP
jgi:hypothetical protein